MRQYLITNLYYSQENEHVFFVSKVGMKLFVGIFSLQSTTSEQNYWGLDEEFGVSVIQITMSRNRFQEIKKCVNLADNNELDKIDTMAKLRPLISLLNLRYRQWSMDKILSIDKAMVKFIDCHSESTGATVLPLGSKVILDLLISRDTF